MRESRIYLNDLQCLELGNKIIINDHILNMEFDISKCDKVA